MNTPPPPSDNHAGGFLFRRFSKVREINEKYQTPRIKTTRAVSIALLLLRLYLILLIGILIFKFITTLIYPS